MNQPKEDSKYSWTDHAWEKMQYYGISESRIKRIIRFPTRIEEGVAEKTVAVMQPGGGKRYSEIWVMYALTKSKVQNPKLKESNRKLENIQNFNFGSAKKIRVITAWRYPGKSPERDPIPDEVLSEVRSLL